MATIKDVSKESGYSISTVSYALSDSPKIPDETKHKIRVVAKNLNYFPNAFARGLKTKKCKSIGVFIPGFDGPIHPTILAGLAEIINQNSGYKLLITLSHDEYPLIYEKQIDIAILIDSKITDEKVAELSDIIPIILFDKKVEKNNVYNTYIENEDGIKKRVFDFVNKGVNKFIYMSGSEFSNHNKERLCGFKKGIMEKNLDLDNQIILPAGVFTEEQGYHVMNDYLNKNKLEAKALICANDELAIGSIMALQEHGYIVPNDILVSGFDNIDKGKFISPSLSTISVNWHEYGKEVGNLALNILNKIKVAKRINIPVDLIDRTSGGNI